MSKLPPKDDLEKRTENDRKVLQFHTKPKEKKSYYGLPIPENSIIVPSNYFKHDESAGIIFSYLKKRLFRQDSVVVECVKGIDDDNRIIDVKPQRLCSLVAGLGLDIWKYVSDRDGNPVLKLGYLNKSAAEIILVCDNELGQLGRVLSCPVITENDGEAKILTKGYHPD